MENQAYLHKDFLGLSLTEEAYEECIEGLFFLGDNLPGGNWMHNHDCDIFQVIEQQEELINDSGEHVFQRGISIISPLESMIID